MSILCNGNTRNRRTEDSVLLIAIVLITLAANYVMEVREIHAERRDCLPIISVKLLTHCESLLDVSNLFWQHFACRIVAAIQSDLT